MANQALHIDRKGRGLIACCPFCVSGGCCRGCHSLAARDLNVMGAKDEAYTRIHDSHVDFSSGTAVSAKSLIFVQKCMVSLPKEAIELCLEMEEPVANDSARV